MARSRNEELDDDLGYPRDLAGVGASPPSDVRQAMKEGMDKEAKRLRYQIEQQQRFIEAEFKRPVQE